MIDVSPLLLFFLAIYSYQYLIKPLINYIKEYFSKLDSIAKDIKSIKRDIERLESSKR